MTLIMALYQDACEEVLADALYDLKRDREMILQCREIRRHRKILDE